MDGIRTTGARRDRRREALDTRDDPEAMDEVVDRVSLLSSWLGFTMDPRRSRFLDLDFLRS